MVSDGSLCASLAPFTITVSAPVVTPPPTTRIDGTPLTNLAGYRVYYRTSHGAYTQRLDLPIPDLTSALTQNLATGTYYYFAATAYDTDGAQSGLTTEATTTIL